jgi:uroporphyrin-III C-methyltransferase
MAERHKTGEMSYKKSAAWLSRSSVVVSPIHIFISRVTNPSSFSIIKRKNSAIGHLPRMLAFSDSTGGSEVMKYSLPGKVYLTGAGPGSAKLLTLRALEVLQAADLVLHDDLVSDDVLACIPARTAVHSVGKRCGQKKISQDELNRRMIKAARSGQTVVRLKGGDPLIFGRTQEEISALRQAGIEFEIIPGITAAAAAAAEAQIPLTERSAASKLVFVSNHPSTDKMQRDWHTSVTRDATMVFYMPGNDFASLIAELAASGLGERTPCLLVSNAARPEQKMVRTTLGALESAPVAHAPSLLIVGSAVAGARGEEWLAPASSAEQTHAPESQEFHLSLEESDPITTE